MPATCALPEPGRNLDHESAPLTASTPAARLTLGEKPFAARLRFSR